MRADNAVERQGPAVYLSLTGRAREVVREISTEDIGAANGLTTILAKLDEVYLKDQSTQAFLAFKEFVHYARESGDTFTDFIIQFEKLYHKCIKHEMNLPEPVRAYFLLAAANLTDDNEKLARTTCNEMNYKSMHTQLKKIFGDVTSSEKDAQAPAIKEEVMYTGGGTRNYYKRFSGGGANRNRTNQRGGAKSGQSTARFPERKTPSNPIGRDGNVLECFKCGSQSHFLQECPQSHKTSKVILFGRI